MASDGLQSSMRSAFYPFVSGTAHQIRDLVTFSRIPDTFPFPATNDNTSPEGSWRRDLSDLFLRSEDVGTPVCFNDGHNSKLENYTDALHPEENVAKFVTIEDHEEVSSDVNSLAGSGSFTGSYDSSIQHNYCNLENFKQSFPKAKALSFHSAGSQMQPFNTCLSSPHQSLSKNTVQRQVANHGSHHSHADNIAYKNLKELKSKNAFSVTGALRKSALVHESKMSISSDPPSPNACSKRGSPRAFFLPIHLASPVISSVVSLKALNEEEYFSLATTRQMSYGSKASSRSSTNSLTGIQTRKRRAEDCNYISQYSLSPSCNNWLSGESPMIIDYLSMHERRGTGNVIPVIAPDSDVQGRFVKRSKRESEEDDDVIFVKAYPAPGPGSATRNTHALKTDQRSSKLIKRRDSNLVVATPVSFAASDTASHHQQAPPAFVAPTIRGMGTSVSQRYNETIPVQRKGYFLRSSVPNQLLKKTIAKKTTRRDIVVSSKQCKVCVAGEHGIKYQTRSLKKNKGIGRKITSTSTVSHQTNAQIKHVTDSKAKATAVTNNVIDSSATFDSSVVFMSSIPPKRLINKKKVYQLEELLGAGGGGSVYSGIRMSDQLKVAIKIISKDKINRWGKINGKVVPIEFELLQMASQSGNEGVIGMIDWFKRQDDSYVLIMERPEPVLDLFEYLNENGAMPESLAKNIFKQLAKAVFHCHGKGVIHRDIKDENVIFNLLTRKAKIIDFGCGTKVKDTSFTEFAGTLEFYPPEWFVERRYEGQAVDCWSLGILLYTMLEAEIPFPKPEDIVRCSLKFKRSMETATGACRHLITSMLQKEKHKRPTLEEVLQHPWLSEDIVDIIDLTSSPLTKLDINSERHKCGFHEVSSNTSADSSIPPTFTSPLKYDQIAQQDIVSRCNFDNAPYFSKTNLNASSAPMAHRPEWSAPVGIRSNECLITV